MTLSDILADGWSLATWLGFDPDELVDEVTRHDRLGHVTTVQIPRHEWVMTWYRQYRDDLHREFVNSTSNQFRHWRSHDQFVRECVREGLGVKSKGTTAAIRQRCITARPDLFQAPDQSESLLTKAG